MPDDLIDVLGELIALAAVGTPERQIMDRGVKGLVQAFPVQGAGASLIDETGGIGVVSASDSTAYALERLQTQLGEGPCIVAHHAGEPCLSPDVGSDPRFLRYGAAAVGIGAAGVYAFPARSGTDVLGTVDLYTSSDARLREDVAAAAQAISDALAGLVLTVRDRSRLTADCARLQEAAGRDPMTGLANRQLLLDRISQSLRRRTRSGDTVAVAFFDIDDFKSINDRFGHRVGDLLLAAIAQRLGTAMRPADTLARLSGDEFAVLFEDLSAVNELERLMARIDDRMRAPFELGDVGLSVTASYGCAVSTDSGDSAEGLIDAADQAMYARKRRRATSPPHPGHDADEARSLAKGVPPLLTGSGRLEWWIDGPTPNQGAFALVVSDRTRGELMISEFDNRALVIQRCEWLPAQADSESAGTSFEAITTDWDGEETAQEQCGELPAAPEDLHQLTRLLDGLHSRG